MPDISKTDIGIIIGHLEARRDGMLAPLASVSTKAANQVRLINRLIKKLKLKTIQTKVIMVKFDFKPYTGTKTIKAAPMGAAEAKRNGAAITDETVKKNIGNTGYLVEYPDGYRSWSPVKAFEETYHLSETYVDRMKIELADLNERICKATKTLYTFSAISQEERWHLKDQLEAMQKYADILYQRIYYAVEPRVISEPSCCNAATKEGGE